MVSAPRGLALSILLACIGTPIAAQSSFVNWETPHVHPLDVTPDGGRLVAVNTPDNRLEVFDATGADLVQLRSVAVGIDPVSVRARTSVEAWVVNHLSDSVSVVDLTTGRVRATLQTSDEPCDVVFAGVPQRAFVSCSQANEVLVFDPLDLGAAPIVIAIDGEDPRALAVSPAGDRVYAAIYESGNATTVLAGGATFDGEYPPKIVDAVATPHGGANPTPNAGTGFAPAQNGANPSPPPVSLIVRRNAAGQWMDDNNGDWTTYVSGPNADQSGRLPGWDLHDHDVAVIDVDSLAVSYVTGLMNINMALAVHPVSGELSVIGTDATNEVRYEPNLTGTFIRVLVAFADAALDTSTTVDLNPHLTYTVPTVPQGQRNMSLGTPRGIAWNNAGTAAYVTGMGSNNLIVIDETGSRVGIASTIEVGEGPTGLVLDEPRGRLYVLDKFESAISVVDLALETETARVPFFDPTPAVIVTGRRHLYDTHETSGLGQIACASCHVDGRSDRLAWDLGNPAGDMVSINGQNTAADHPMLADPQNFTDFHPMKGPMLTQTLQDIIGKEPLHWRGDKDGVEEFNGAFIGLQGDNENLTTQEMQEFEDFLATIYYPPNPFRNFDNSFSDDVPLPGHYTTGKFQTAGQPLPNGDAQNGLDLFQPPNLLDGDLACATCHTLPTGIGVDGTWNGAFFTQLATGPLGEHHHMLLRRGEQNMKVPTLRNLYERTGFNTTQLSNSAGFGYLNDGTFDSVERFVSIDLFEAQSVQEVADLVAFLLSFSGSDMPQGTPGNLMQPPGTLSNDTHAAVGAQLTQSGPSTPEEFALMVAMLDLADEEEVGLVAKHDAEDREHGYVYVGGGIWQSDEAGTTLTSAALQQLASPGSEVTFTVVPFGTETRIGIDRDEDTHLDGDEFEAATDGSDPADVPGACSESSPSAPSGLAVVPGVAGQMALSWTDASANEFSFLLERRIPGSGPYVRIAELPADTTHFTDIGLTCSESYSYRLRARNCAGTSGAVTAAGVAAACDALVGDIASLSLFDGGVQNLSVEAGPQNAGNFYAMFGSFTGTSPGLPFAGAPLPLNYDAYFKLLLTNPNTPPLLNGFNVLDPGGKGIAQFTVPGNTYPWLAGLTLNHAYLVLSPSFAPLSASNAVALALLP